MAGATLPSALESKSLATGSAKPADKGASAGAAHSAQNACGTPDRTVGQFIRTFLAEDQIKMSPMDGWVSASERTWVLAGSAAEPVLIYSLSGEEIALAGPLPVAAYSALWFDSRSGEAREAGQVPGPPHTTFTKPDQQPWLLLLLPNRLK